MALISTPLTADRARRLGRRLLGSPLVEALTTPHPVDRYLELVNPRWTVHEVRAEVTAVRRTAAGSVTLALRVNGVWEGFRAGQHVQVTVEIDGVSRTRSYSPACSEHGDGRTLELTVREHENGEVSRFLNAEARPGTTLRLSQAQGDFTLPDARPANTLLIAGGSGITPLMAMLRTLCDEGHDRPVTLVHYVRSAAEAIYAAELDDLARRHPSVRVVRVTTRDAVTGQLRGHFAREHLLAAAPGYTTAETFVCGPPALIDAVRELYAAEGLDARLHVEHFVPPAPAVVLGDAQGTLRFARTGSEAPNEGGTLLEQAERAGLRPDHGCRMGICHTCTCRKVSGSVRDARTGEVSTAPGEHIRICISVPVGDVELDL